MRYDSFQFSLTLSAPNYRLNLSSALFCFVVFVCLFFCFFFVFVFCCCFFFFVVVVVLTNYRLERSLHLIYVKLTD